MIPIPVIIVLINILMPLQNQAFSCERNVGGWLTIHAYWGFDKEILSLFVLGSKGTPKRQNGTKKKNKYLKNIDRKFIQPPAHWQK